MNAKPNTNAAEREQRAGAKSCLAIVQRLEQITVPDPSDMTERAWLAKRDAAIAALLETAGELLPRAAGAMSLLAELVVSERQDCSTYHLDKWKPHTAMTISARTRTRAKIMSKADAEEMILSTAEAKRVSSAIKEGAE